MVALTVELKDVMEDLGKIDQTKARDAGSLDHCTAPMQMKAIGMWLEVYFQQQNWLQARDNAFPRLRKSYDPKFDAGK